MYLFSDIFYLKLITEYIILGEGRCQLVEFFISYPIIFRHTKVKELLKLAYLFLRLSCEIANFCFVQKPAAPKKSIGATRCSIDTLYNDI